MIHGLRRVVAIDVEEVDTAIGEIADRFVKCRTNQPRERRVPAVMVVTPLRKHGLIVEAGVWIPFPGIDRVARRSQTQLLHGLCECRVAVARVRAELDEDPGT